MLEDIRSRHLNYCEIFQSAISVYKRHFNFIFAINLLVFISYNIIPYDISESNFGIIITLFYSLIVYPFVFITFFYIVRSYIDNSSISYNEIWELCWIKMPKTINVQLFLLPYAFGVILLVLLMVVLLNIFIPLLKMHLFAFSVYGSGLIIVISGLCLFIMTYFFQYSLHAVVVNNKRSREALEYSFQLVKENPWESLAIIGISLFSLFCMEFISPTIIKNLPEFLNNGVFPWIIAFIFEMLSSFFIFINIIGYLNINYAYQRQNDSV